MAVMVFNGNKNGRVKKYLLQFQGKQSHAASITGSLPLFRLAGGLAWLGVLTFGSLGEQLKTRWEVAEREEVDLNSLHSTKELS
jgi:hypothetical protein